MRESSSRWVHLDVTEILSETDKAFLVVLEGKEDTDAIWLPKSQISEAEKYRALDCNVTLSVTEWIAREKGLN